MARLWTSLLLLLATLSPGLARASEGGIDEAVNKAVEPIANAIANVVFFSVPIGGADLRLIVVWLIVGGVFFTIYLRFLPFRAFGTAIDLVRGRYDDPNDPGEVSHFQALATALSGTVGLGNIAGVGVAVAVGGPGATFWMILAGFLGMSAKLAECTLAVKYRKVHPDGSISGGPMYYLEQGLAAKGYGFGRPLGVAYAITMLFACVGGGNMFQSNQAFEMLMTATGGEASFFAGKGWLVGIVLAVSVGTVIIGGIKSIARVTDKLVPAMAVLYLVTGILVLVMNIEALPGALVMIVKEAFAPVAITGGVLGALIQGFQRAAFSNEAGLGSAAVAHSAVKTDEPATEGLVALLEPFIDTIVICTVTSLVIVTTVYTPGVEGGISLTAAAFDKGIAGSSKVMALAAVLFAFSTAISWSYYGLKAWTYLVGDSPAKVNGFKIVFCAFTAIGAMASLEAVILFSDSMIFVLALFNLFGMYFLAPVIKAEIEGYLGRIKSGEIQANK
jgi:AGCS family alanine or glycine:cation symporter